MIRRYNHKEGMLGLACILFSLVGYACAYLFFRYLPQLTCHLFGLEISPTLLTLASFGTLILITIAGYLRWKNQGGFYSYYDSAISHQGKIPCSTLGETPENQSLGGIFRPSWRRRKHPAAGENGEN